MRRRVAAILLACAGFGCAEPAPEVFVESQGTTPSDAPRDFPGRSYERNFVFTTVTGDSLLIVPWLFETTTQPGTVVREARGWLDRSGTWDAFFAERWQTPPTRIPARVLPHGSLKLVVRDGNAVDGIIYDEGDRNLELALGSVLMEWGGPRGEVFQLLDGSLYLSDRRLGGIVLDMARGSSAETPRAGDWAFLASGDSLQLVLQGESEHQGEPLPAYRGWGRLDLRNLQWSPLTVDWVETNAFQPARRDVPVSWTISSPDGELQGTLEVSSADVRAGQGSGPVLPVQALFEVEGTVTIEGRTFPVRGLFRHEQR
jgi:hypothetical protein